MRVSLCIPFLLIISSLFCQNYNITLVSTVEFPGQTLSNIWGYAAGGKEYALVGTANGMTIVDVTNPASPVQLQQLTDGITSQWREIKTYGAYAYITSENVDINNEGGLGIADLSSLPIVPVPFKKYHGDGIINGLLKRVHALDVDEALGFVYLYGPDAINPKGIICLDLADRWNPTYAGKYQGSYVHDGYSSNNIVYGSHIYAGQFSIIDFTNKSNPVVTAMQMTPNAFTHNTWPSLDGNYLFTTDEKSNSYLTAYDISDPSDIFETDRIATTPGSGSIVHNTYIFDHYAVTSWYKDGITITDVDRPGNLIQVGRYDTYPQGTGSGFEGAWGVYPYLPSQTLLVTNINESGAGGGVLYILTPTYVDACYLEGKVKDADTNANLFGVGVDIQHTDPLNYTTTDLVGDYATGQPTPGTFTVKFSLDSYITQSLSVNLSSGAVTQLDVFMEPLSLPLELAFFSGQPKGGHNVLHWETAVEKDITNFEVHRSLPEDHHWTTIGIVEAVGSTNSQTQYQFSDKEPLPEALYRLNVVEADGKEQLSKVIHISRRQEGFRLEKVYPIPSSGEVLLEMQTDHFRSVDLVLYDRTGRTLFTDTFDLEKGDRRKIVSLPEDIPSGCYWILLASGNERLQADIVLLR